MLVSWGTAFFEYRFAVPAHRTGCGADSGQQLKILHEVITMAVLAVFPAYYLGEELLWNSRAASFCLIAAVGFIVIPAR